MQWWNEIYDFIYTHENLWYPSDLMKEITASEIDSLQKILNLKEGSTILDVGCGRGRHSIEFAMRGHNVTGLDLSEKLISLAEEEYKKNISTVLNKDDYQGSCVFQISDMRKIDFHEEFDAIIFMDVSFGIFDDEENQKIINKTHDALKPGGKVFFSLFNPYWWSTHPHTRHWGDETGEVIRKYSFNSLEGRIEDRQVYINAKEGIRKKLPLQTLRAYTFPEMKKMCKKAGFTSFSLYGDKGDFTPDPGVEFNPGRSMGMFVVAKR